MRRRQAAARKGSGCSCGGASSSTRRTCAAFQALPFRVSSPAARVKLASRRTRSSVTRQRLLELDWRSPGSVRLLRGLKVLRGVILLVPPRLDRTAAIAATRTGFGGSWSGSISSKCAHVGSLFRLARWWSVPFGPNGRPVVPGVDRGSGLPCRCRPESRSGTFFCFRRFQRRTNPESRSASEP
jgi:hypothetical protein